MANMDTTCPGNAIPEVINLPIPQNINVFVTTGTNASYQPMEVCCQPNVVQVADKCWLWCEVPRSYFNGTDGNGAGHRISSCVARMGRELNDPRQSSTFQMNTAAARPGMGSLKEIGLWVLALSGFVYML